MYEIIVMASKGLMAASTKPLILGILKEGKSYGYLIIQRVKELSGGSLEWSDGMLYPVLHRLEKDGYIESEWTITANGRKRKYYSITDQGKQELIAEKEDWLSVQSILAKVWGILPTE